MASRLGAALGIAAAALLLTLPAASAHTAAYSTDGRVRASVGLLNEPVVTYKDTGLDLCFTQNVTATPRPPITTVNPGALTATLESPSGHTLTEELEAQFGRPGCFTFARPLVLTEAGVYHLDLVGDVNGSRFDVRDQVVGSADGVGERRDVTWPDEGVATNLELEAQVRELEDRLEQLEADAEEPRGAPAPAAALVALGLAALAAVRRLR